LRSHEVQNYVKHRIAVASNHARVHFTKGAYRAIYQYSTGIPRLVNIVCDRSLITAFSREQKKITRSIVQTSILELSGRGNIRQFKRRQWLKVVLPISLAGLVALSILLYRLEVFDAWLPFFNSDPSAAIPAAKSPGVHDENRPGDQSKRGPAQAPNLLSTEEAFSAHLKSIDAATSPQVALKKILQEWNIDARIDPAIEVISDAGAFFRLASKNRELQVQRLDADLTLVGRLNHPAILEMTLAAAGKTVYLAINKVLGNTLSLYNGSGDSTFELPMDLVAKYYSGVAYVFWKDFLSYRGTIPLTAPKESVITLKMHLKDIGYRDLPIDSKYDAQTRSVVRQIQKKYGLVQDGIVGSMTKIALYNEKETLAIPRLSNGLPQQEVN
jgi:general secretion pathway protein A